MRNLKMWKRLLAVGMCSAMMLSVPMGVSANDPVTKGEPKVETTTEAGTTEDESTKEKPDEETKSGDVTDLTNTETPNDETDSTAKEDGTEDNGENNEKTIVTLFSKDDVLGLYYDVTERSTGNYSSGISYTYDVTGESAAVVADMIDVELVKATVGDFDITSAITIGDIKSDVKYGNSIDIKVSLSMDVLKTLNIKKSEEYYNSAVEIAIKCKNDSYQLDINNLISTFYVRYLIGAESNTGTNTDNTNTGSVSKYPVSDVKLSKARMQELVEISKEQDIVINTPSGLSYVFKKGDFQLAGDKDEYDFSATLITDFSKSGINNNNVTLDTFVSRINYAYSGQLPGTAIISIPVAGKWNNRTLYYYQIMSDGTLKDTGKSSKVTNGICQVSQSHCSDYVLLTKSPSELGLTGAATDTKIKSPKTGDASTALLFVLLCMGACIAGTGAVMVRCKSR